MLLNELLEVQHLGDVQVGKLAEGVLDCGRVLGKVLAREQVQRLLEDIGRLGDARSAPGPATQEGGGVSDAVD